MCIVKPRRLFTLTNSIWQELSKIYWSKLKCARDSEEDVIFFTELSKTELYFVSSFIMLLYIYT